VDLAAWANGLDALKAWQRARVAGLRRLAEHRGIAFAHHLEIFVLDASHGGHLGRLCNFKRCPAEKDECLVRGCGEARFLRQVADFAWHDDALAPQRHVVLYDPHADPPITPCEALPGVIERPAVGNLNPCPSNCLFRRTGG